MAVWQECEMKWWYRYKLRMPLVATGPMVSGGAIHAGLEGALLGKKTVADAWRVAGNYLGEENIEKYGPGAKRALEATPSWLWEVEVPQVELKLEVQLGGHVVVGKPDLWWVDKDGAFVVEFKSTSDDPSRKLEDYQPLGNPQPLRYAVLVDKYLEGKLPVYVMHLILSTRGKVCEGAWYPVSRSVLEREEKEMVEIVGRMERAPLWHRSWACGRCEFKEIDEVRVTGGEWEWNM